MGTRPFLEVEGATRTDGTAGVRPDRSVRVAALFVRADGPYADRPDVDAWDVVRDARSYAGPWPVVAHPPCARWGRLWAMHGKKLGDDAGCFAAALGSVDRFGGVLEHPEASRAWDRFGLPVPTHGAGWTRGLFDRGWACSVDQSVYGHRARKRTWLYYVGTTQPPPLDWRDGSDLATAVIQTSRRVCRSIVERMGQRERELTPAPFVEVLIDLAARSGGQP